MEFSVGVAIQLKGMAFCQSDVMLPVLGTFSVRCVLAKIAAGSLDYMDMVQCDIQPAHTWLVPPMLAATQLISACEDSKDATLSIKPQATSKTENDPLNAPSPSTVAVSPEVLFDFLFVSTRFEFWSCMSSVNDTAIYLTTIRTRPGRSFTADNQLDKIQNQLHCRQRWH